MRMKAAFDHAWTRRGFREGLPCPPTWGEHLLTARMFNARERTDDVRRHRANIATTYTPAVPSYADAVLHVKNHFYKTWRRFEDPEAQALIEHHVRGGVFDET